MTFDFGILRFTDPQGQKITCTPVESTRGDHFDVEVVKDGEVVDHFALYGVIALGATAKSRGWTK